MGTNYYLEQKAPCQSCGRAFDRLHIGKSSAGWCFALHVIPDDGINDLPDWVDLWKKPGVRIFDEYGKQFTPDDMLMVILARFGRANKEAFDINWLRDNHATIGPFGLARHSSPGWHAGAGTYDIGTGEFS